MNDLDRHHLARPTEAQLRWAEFHHKRRAARVQEAVSKYWMQPANVSDVDGAQSQDGNTTEESSSENSYSGSCANEIAREALKQRLSRRSRRNKPKVSRGRRALLNVSKRAFKRRCEDIAEHGFRRGSSDDAERKSDQIDDGLAGMFADETFLRKRRLRRNLKKCDVDEDRVRRFEAAFESMMLNLLAAQGPQQEEIVATRVWTRPSEHIHDIDYSSFKGLANSTHRHTKHNLMRNSSAVTPMLDRGASWLIHLPQPTRTKQMRSQQPTIGNDLESEQATEDFLTEQVMDSTYNDRVSIIVDVLQKKLSQSNKGNANGLSTSYNRPMMRLSKLFQPAKLDDTREEKKEDENDFFSPQTVRRLEVAFLSASKYDDKERIVSSKRISEIVDFLAIELGSDFMHSNELSQTTMRQIIKHYVEHSGFDPEIDNFETARRHLKTLSARFLPSNVPNDKELSENTFPKQSTINEFVKCFVEFMENAAFQEPLVDADGKLHKQTFARILNRYLEEARKCTFSRRLELMQPPLASEHALDEQVQHWTNIFISDELGAPSQQFTNFAEQLVKSLELAAEHEPFVDSCGELKRQMFEKLVARYLAEVSSVKTKDVACESLQKDLNQKNEIDFSVIESDLDIKHLGDMNSYNQLVVKGLVFQIEQAASAGSIFTKNGVFNRAKFGKVVLDYFQPKTNDSTSFLNQMKSPEMLAQARMSASNLSRRRMISNAQTDDGDVFQISSLDEVDRLLNSMDDAIKAGLLLQGENRFERKKLEHIVVRFLSEFHDDIKRQPDFVCSELESGNQADTCFMPETICHEGASQFEVSCLVGKKSLPQEVELTDNTSSICSKNIPQGVSGRLGKVVKMIYNGNNNEELNAVAAFRRSSDHRKANDDTSSYSSFRILPKGIRNVVQSIRGAQPIPNEDDFDESVVYSQSSTDDLEHSQSEELSDATSHSSLTNTTSRRNKKSVDLSPEKLRSFHQQVMNKSALNQHQTVIDTDRSDTSRPGLDPRVLSSLLLSPTILTKRLQQAIRAVEKRNWEQVEYLLSANPWLSEMIDLRTNQYILHKLALFGSEVIEYDDTNGKHILLNKAAPKSLNSDLLRMFPSSVVKFDTLGNLPLHFAAASANLPMITLLGDSFPSGASVRNDDGMLPLHLVTMGIASRYFEDPATPIIAVKTILQYFPGAIAVADNEGNLPIHTAVSVVTGDVGVDIVCLLLEEANKQLQDPYGVRFRNNTKSAVSRAEELLSDDSAFDTDILLHCNMVCNNYGETPLSAAIHTRAGWMIIEALVQNAGGIDAIMLQDSNMNNALHQLVCDRGSDPAAVMSLLKVAPDAASYRNDEGLLPIEIACMQMLPQEVIFALVLVDLPISLEKADEVQLREGYGASWFYITCEADDHYVDVVENILKICTYQQVRALCFVCDIDGTTLLPKATEKCRAALQRSLRFAGRFEFTGIVESVQDEVRMFEAVDYGDRNCDLPNGCQVLLKCYTSQIKYNFETRLLQVNAFDWNLFEKICMFTFGEEGMTTAESGSKQFCVSIEKPELTLAGIVSSLLKNMECQNAPNVRHRYIEKVFAVLRLVAKALQFLHERGIVHGDVHLEHCCKYDDKWKLAGILTMQKVGELICNKDGLSYSLPPECLEGMSIKSRLFDGIIRPEAEAHPSLDSWAFGKLSYDALVGEPLFAFQVDAEQNLNVWMEVFLWNDQNVLSARRKLESIGVPALGVDLISQCLSPRPGNRPVLAEISKRLRSLKIEYPDS